MQTTTIAQKQHDEEAQKQQHNKEAQKQHWYGDERLKATKAMAQQKAPKSNMARSFPFPFL
jgi:hypothetical protein